jgi:hypothetical protein
MDCVSSTAVVGEIFRCLLARTTTQDFAARELDLAIQINNVAFLNGYHEPARILAPVEQVSIAFAPQQSVESLAARTRWLPVGRGNRAALRPREPTVRSHVGVACAQYEHLLSLVRYRFGHDNGSFLGLSCPTMDV